jgi:HEAT repeat protein
LAWLKFNDRSLSIEELRRLILQGSEISAEIRKALKSLSPDERWCLLRVTFPELTRTKLRDLVRALFSNRLPFMRELLANKEERELAIECLGYLASRDSVELLVSLLSHKDDDVQLNAAGALKNHTPRLVVPALIEALLSGTGSPARVGEVLAEMGFLAMEGLVEAYPKANPLTKSQILEILILAHYPKIKELVREALESEEKPLRLKGLEALAVFLYDDLWEEAVFCLTDRDWSVRAKTLQVLEKLKVKGIEDLIQPFTGDEDPWVCQCAKHYLASVTSKRDGE